MQRLIRSEQADSCARRAMAGSSSGIASRSQLTSSISFSIQTTSRYVWHVRCTTIRTDSLALASSNGVTRLTPISTYIPLHHLKLAPFALLPPSRTQHSRLSHPASITLPTCTRMTCTCSSRKRMPTSTTAGSRMRAMKLFALRAMEDRQRSTAFLTGFTRRR